uniref:Uncharacterized protein n=1 Tax=Arundo donax TaxID=35708 RepID=A0A0A9F3H4_ARUDO
MINAEDHCFNGNQMMVHR